MKYGIRMVGAQANSIKGNYLGLLSDGETAARCRDYCLRLGQDCSDNQIGGPGSLARNVFVSAKNGLEIVGAGAANNKIEGNFFGLNVPGTAQRQCNQGIRVWGGAGANQIGGSAANTGNYFTPKGSDPPTGIRFDGAGRGSVVRGNTFGVRPDDVVATRMSIGILANNVRVNVLGNRIVRAGNGIYASGPTADSKIRWNKFNCCRKAVRLESQAQARLGDAATAEGRNVFRPTNTWHIYNNTPNAIDAEGNSFGTTSKTAIDSKIYDHLDSSSLGLVDYDPLKGGVHPTGQACPLTLASASALSAKGGGAEIAFNLSADADVTISVLNIAGRPVATLARDRAAGAGLQRVLWSGQTNHGTCAPSGTYLVRILARAADGGQVQSICPLRLER